ncbi:uncharacterized protein LOC131180582 [Hevea brasiliensis]|uniref:uncharacterized protein LOC131180582 n=1 Tax=Hevea brasiliensis TaxID=3981 RepID=UPI0025FC2CC9|nr:uncharacterized protein LOC131180582 [Hevea brasiliensis]
MVFSRKDFGLTCFTQKIWSLWLDRNDKVFNGKDSSTFDSYAIILHLLSPWVKALDADFPYSATDLFITSESIRSWTNHPKCRRVSPWIAPTLSSFNRNVDGSSLGRPRCMDSNAAELLAIRKALEISVPLPILKEGSFPIYLESNLQVVVSWVLDSPSAP